MIKINGNIVTTSIIITFIFFMIEGCVPTQIVRDKNVKIPEQFQNFSSDSSSNVAAMNWREYFNDTTLNHLIDDALKYNQELNIMVQNIDINKNEIQARKGEYLPFLGIRGAAEVEKVGRYTSKGANDATTDIKPGEEMPEPLPNFGIEAFANWELDIWKKLRNAKKAAMMEYFATVEGKNFLVTNLVSEVANTYYELLALDNKLAIINRNIELVEDAVRTVKLQKLAAKSNELGVQRLQAEVYKNYSQRYEILQSITIKENELNILVGRIPEHINRDTATFWKVNNQNAQLGIPSQLLNNRADIRKAEYEIQAAKLNTQVARASFFPSVSLRAGVGLESFNIKYFVTTPQSLLFNLAGDLVAPIVNRNAIKAQYYNASDRQLQSVIEYEQKVINAFTEVINDLNQMENSSKEIETRNQQVNAQEESFKITNQLFRAARVDYLEVLMNQRDVLDAKLDLVEAKMSNIQSKIKIYHDLGGGWQE